ncbi:MAG: hypothetical protein MK101_11550 [Phycisphaerales bacterium]|nr:hypothetical protein [Phycisphaerales bacterium]
MITSAEAKAVKAHTATAVVLKQSLFLMSLLFLSLKLPSAGTPEGDTRRCETKAPGVVSQVAKSKKTSQTAQSDRIEAV